jgi:hypothetical protein
MSHPTPDPPKQRTLSFATTQEMIQEIQRLSEAPYQRAATWSLGQNCQHLAGVVRGCMDGFPFQFPWPIRGPIGRLVLSWASRGGRITRRLPAPKAFQPQEDADDHVQAQELIALLERFEAHEGDLYPSPVLGRRTKDQWRSFHLMHGAHHLGFLLPEERASPPTTEATTDRAAT